MKGILADVNIEGHVDRLVAMIQSGMWKPAWDALRIRYFTFADLALAANSPDSLVWESCQKEELILVTDNRNQNDPDSLEATIQARNTAASLPVFTIASIPQLRNSRTYAIRVIDKMLDFLGRIDALRGSGRLFLP